MPACRALLVAIGTAVLSCGPALADEQSVDVAVPQTAIAGTGDPSSQQDVAGIGPALSLDALDRHRGGDDSVQNHVDIHGQLDGNTAQDIASGNNTVGGDAFANASGLTTVIQNSGSNVLIQNGMVVNVRFAGSGP